MNYKEQLLSKDWKRKRLQILKLDKKTCTKCNGTEIAQLATKQVGLVTKRVFVLNVEE